MLVFTFFFLDDAKEEVLSRLPPSGDEESKSTLAMFLEQEEEKEVGEDGLQFMRDNEPGELLRNLR